MRWPAITSLPCCDAMKNIFTGNISREYYAVATYCPQKPVVADTVYFASAEDYLADLPSDPRVAFILLCTDHTTIDTDVDTNQNVGRFDDRDNFENCFYHLQEEFAFEREIQKGMRDLVTMTSSNDSIEHLVEHIHRIFKLPVSVIDTSYTYIASSSGFEDLSMELYDDIRSGRVRPEIQTGLNQTDTFHPMGIRRRAISFKTILSTTEGKPIFNNLALIYIGNAVAGSISLFTVDEPLTRWRREQLPAVASILSMEVQKGDYWLENKGAFYTRLLTSLIEDDSSGKILEQDAKLRFKAGGYDLRQYKYLIRYDLSEESFTVRETQSLAKRIRDELPNAIFFIDGGDIVYLMSTDEYVSTDDLEDRIKDNLVSTALDSTLIRVGISSCFGDIRLIKRHYSQSIRAINAGRSMGRNQQVFSYDKTRLPDLFSHLENPDDYEIYLYPPLVGVLDEDQKKGSHLAFTLYCYLKDSENIEAVCKELGIHKNTLYFRLNKAREIMHHDYKRGDVAMEILLSFRMLEYHGKLKHFVIDTEKNKKRRDVLGEDDR